MTDLNQNTAAVPPSTPNNSSEKKVGPIVASLIIVLVLIIAALYVFASRITQPMIPDDSSSVAASVPAVTSTSTDLRSLQSDLNVSTKGLKAQNF